MEGLTSVDVEIEGSRRTQAVEILCEREAGATRSGDRVAHEVNEYHQNHLWLPVTSGKGKGMTQTHTLRLHPYGGTAQRERWCERSACARGATRERVPERV